MPKRKLINPDDLVIASVEHQTGADSHYERDCPGDRTCPVWDAWHRKPVGVLERWQAEAPAWLTEAIADYYGSWAEHFDKMGSEHLAWDDGRIDDFLCYTMRQRRFERNDGFVGGYEVREIKLEADPA